LCLSACIELIPKHPIQGKTQARVPAGQIMQ
jgi:hypothetical protein